MTESHIKSSSTGLMGLEMHKTDSRKSESQNLNPLPGPRIYDYKQKYSQDKLGEEFKENARVWNVYLDEAENYDADLIEGYRNIMDGLLVFAALFSAVVTTFVAQTSQTLQPDNTQILVSILLETNQLLRAAGNNTSLNAVPPATLGPGSLTYSLTDQWVNGLFFTSLALSLSTSLLTVLAKQWIQGYTSNVSGGARTRALIRQFRFHGLVKWRLTDMIESLPVILHSSVALFLVGLALYVSEFSSPICGVVAFITALTFLFYLGTSIIPAIFIDCPYRLPFLFPLAQLMVYVCGVVKHAFQFLQQWFLSGCSKMPDINWVTIPTKSLKVGEHNAVFPNSNDEKYFSPLDIQNTGQFTRDALNWILNHSSNSSAKEIVSEGITRLVDKGNKFSLLLVIQHDLFSSVVLFALDKVADIASPSTTEDDLKGSPWFKLIDNLRTMWQDHPRFTLLNRPLTHEENGKKQIWIRMQKTLKSALLKADHVLTKHLLHWCQHQIRDMEKDLLIQTVQYGNKENISYALDNGLDIDWHNEDGGTLLHAAAWYSNLDGVMVLVERKPSLIDIKAKWIPFPELKGALDTLSEQHFNPLTCTLNEFSLHSAANSSIKFSLNPNLIQVLCIRGQDKTGWKPVDIAKAKGQDDIVAILESNQTVRVEPKPATSGALDSQMP
ncbi:hypothetical protein H2248_007105 [Termitomyces sp. 'cryptogamus']|nr:hypothetical protein H2248_007105 [Termitomyces sp. 'cryptogamus']